MVEHSLRSLHSRDHNSSRCIPVTVDLCTPPLTLSQTGGAATPSSKITMLLQEFIVNVSAVEWSQDSVECQVTPVTQCLRSTRGGTLASHNTAHVSSRYVMSTETKIHFDGCGLRVVQNLNSLFYCPTKKR